MPSVINDNRNLCRSKLTCAPRTRRAKNKQYNQETKKTRTPTKHPPGMRKCEQKEQSKALRPSYVAGDSKPNTHTI